VVTCVSTWCSGKKLSLSAEKNRNAAKGKLDADMPPITKINGKSISMRETIKYLGVYFESGLKIARHVQ
jgi:hypothetical protein